MTVEPANPKLTAAVIDNKSCDDPSAEAVWSLLFTPILGAWLHAKNWQELNQADRAKKSMIWVYGGFVFLLAELWCPGPESNRHSRTAEGF